MNKFRFYFVALVAFVIASLGVSYFTPLPIETPPLLVALVLIALFVGVLCGGSVWRNLRQHFGSGVFRMLRCSLAAAVLLPLLLLFGTGCQSDRPGAPAKTRSSSPVTGQPRMDEGKFTNALSGVGGLHRTNVLFQFTNGSTIVTSAPVALRGKGFSLELSISPTNALLTNVVNEFRFSRDGTNWLSDPVFLWRAGGSAIAAGHFNVGTNVLEDAHRNFRFIQHWKIHLTNGANTVGSAFCSNRPPVIITQHYD
jgi:hypothetical protein